MRRWTRGTCQERLGPVRPVRGVQMELRKRVAFFVFALCAAAAVAAPVFAQAPAPTQRAAEIQAAYDAGMKFMEEEKYEEAMAEFTKATADDTFAEAYLGEGDALRKLEDYQAAIQAY